MCDGLKSERHRQSWHIEVYVTGFILVKSCFRNTRSWENCWCSSHFFYPLLSLATSVHYWVWCGFYLFFWRTTFFWSGWGKRQTLSFQEHGVSLWTHQQFSVDWFVNVKVTLLSSASELPVYKRQPWQWAQRTKKKKKKRYQVKKQELSVLNRFYSNFRDQL